MNTKFFNHTDDNTLSEIADGMGDAFHIFLAISETFTPELAA